ncbi:alpha/beta fold hydrolase BchO [Rhodovulum adriaticum]|uniref:Magnesium chelatase accessory protein n=1 Tax=Rhodovulum adriaticum TaxID=35804 RepID=A0A4R2NZR5_RHOAD|nr:alpha/beta fold hydrolase BchO [Rhodovulum adriaticum]MBK1636759.1 magnesium chelatase [Rhodovulum adriaticum]TCP27687.1 magnesium chelatase accessory protein [Rhodovulum adriaticum]
MDWARDGQDWPNRAHSRFVRHRPHRWHIQDAGSGLVVLLLHGTGAATHSWRDVFPILARRYRVVALDLPGQGFTQLGARQRCGLDRMSQDIAALMAGEGLQPAAVVGHSAGAALGMRLLRDLTQPPHALVGINAALENFKGMAGLLFPMMARMMAINPFSASEISRWLGNATGVESIIGGTGSRLSPEGLALYRTLVADRHHTDATLAMISQWDLDGLQADLPRIDTPTLLLVGDMDRAVPPATSVRAAERMPDAHVEHFPDLGHLAHEEAPEAVSARILAFLDARL